MSDLKKKFWSFILYPESAPVDWVDVLVKRGLVFCVSPLHCLDKTDDGMLKKEHYHILIAYQNTTTFSNIKNITDSLNQPIPQPIDNIKGAYDYLTHKNSPGKAQYSDTDIQCYNNFDIDSLIELSSKEINQLIIDTQSFIREKDITEYSILLDILADNELFKMYDVAIHHTILFTAYLRSRRHLKDVK